MSENVFMGDPCPTGEHEQGCCHCCDHGYPVACVCLEIGVRATGTEATS